MESILKPAAKWLSDGWKKYGKIPNWVTAIMILAAFSSLGNIQDYLSDGHTNWMTTLGISVALAFSLVIISKTLAELELKWSIPVIVISLVGIGAAFLSGYMQMQVYLSHGYDDLSAILLGYGVPVFGEIGLAFVVSLLKMEKSRSRANAMRNNMSDGIFSAMELAVNEINPEQIRRQAQRAALGVSTQIVDGVIDEFLIDVQKRKLEIDRSTLDLQTQNAELERMREEFEPSRISELEQELKDAQNQLSEAQTLAQTLAQELKILREDAENLEKQNFVLSTKLDGYSSVSQSFNGNNSPKKEDKVSPNKKLSAKQRRPKVLEILTQTLDKNSFNAAAVAEDFGTSDQTIRNDLAWLIDNGHWQNGDQWTITDNGKRLLNS